MGRWNNDSFGDIKGTKEATSRDIARIDSCEEEGVLSSELAAQRAIMKVELEELVLKEEVVGDKNLELNGLRRVIVIQNISTG